MNHFCRGERLHPFLTKLRARQPALLVTLGDSNTCNADFSAGAKQWPELLHTGLKERFGYQELMLFNAGICGDTVLEGLARLDRDVLRFQPDLVIVCFGTNDRKLDVATFRRGLYELVQRIEASGATVLLRTPLPIMEVEPAPSHIWKNDVELRDRLAVVREVAEARTLAFADNYALWCEREQQGRLVMAELMADPIHSNAAGHRLIFEQLLEFFPS